MFGGESTDVDQTSAEEKDFQQQRYSELLEVLVSSGYFRARLLSLSAFDKIIGGLVWAISQCDTEGVDVDILFTENSTIGQRIKLSEAIVDVLRKMKCPAPLQAHQIQGNDVAAIYPVVVWLVKKFFENREATQGQLRAFAKLQFGKSYTLPEDEQRAHALDGLGLMKTQYRAERMFRRHEMDMRKNTEESRVHSCLVEYGESVAKRFGMTAGGGGPGDGASASGGSSGAAAGGEGEGDGSVKPSDIFAQQAKMRERAEERKRNAAASAEAAGMVADTSGGGDVVGFSFGNTIDLSKAGANELSGFERKLAQAQREAMAEEEAMAREVHEQEQQIMEQMSQVDEKGLSTVAGSQVGAIVGLQSSEIASAVATYDGMMEKARKELGEGHLGGTIGKAAQFKRQQAAYERELSEQEQVAQRLREECEATRKRLALVQEERTSSATFNDQLREQIQKLEEVERKCNRQADLEKLKSLVSLNESLRGQEADFKAQCKKQLGELQESVRELEHEDEGDEEAQRARHITEVHAKIMAKYNRLRQLLADRNLAVANTQRLIDDVPTRTELIQYERRFVELYQQVAWKLEETRKYYATYNTLDETRNFLGKEVKLINSISDNFDAAMASEDAQHEFLAQFQVILRGVQDSMGKQTQTLRDRQENVENLKQSYQSLVDQQRAYFTAVKDFRDECTKNELLAERAQRITAASQGR